MQEQMSKAMDQLNETVGDDVPTLKEVSDKIEARYAKAQAASELQETNVGTRIQEIEMATANVEAQGRLSQLREELGLNPAPAAPTPAELLGEAAPATAEAPVQQANPATGS
jgi:phage shock protein A